MFDYILIYWDHLKRKPVDDAAAPAGGSVGQTTGNVDKHEQSFNSAWI